LKKLNITNLWFEKALFFFNTVNTIFLFLCFVLCFFYNPLLSSISFLTFLFPLFYLINFVFLIYWILKLDFRFLLSLLVFAFLQINSFSIFNFKKEIKENNQNFHVMSFNARLFNHYKWIDNENIPSEIKRFFSFENPDLIAIQEYHRDYQFVTSDFKYKYVYFSGSNSGKSIHTNKEIVGRGVVDFENSDSNAIFVDIVHKNDTIRVFNAHFESFKLNVPTLKADIYSLKTFLTKTKIAYEAQEKQLNTLINQMGKSPYDVILAIDLNNTPNSYVYRKIKNKYDDVFDLKGSGFGSTYNFNYLPLRIDYIFVSKSILPKKFKIYKDRFSDHRPISAFF